MLTEEDVVDNFLAHYGVKGMRWGVIRKPSRTSNSLKGRKENPKNDKKDRETLKTEFDNFTQTQKFGSMNGPEPRIEDQGFFKSLTPEQKKAALIFGGAVIVAGLAYGAHKYGVTDNLFNKSVLTDPKDLLEIGDPLDFDRLGGPHKEGLRAYANQGIELKSGSLVARVSTEVERNIRPGGFFAAHEYNDIQSYVDFLGQTGGHTNYFEATKSIKAPNTRQYIGALSKAMDHPDVLKARKVDVKKLNKMSASDREKVLLRLARDELAKNDFAFSLNASTVEGLLPKRFVSQILSDGFTSVVDYNNASPSVAKAPLRHLDGSMFKFKTSELITSEVKQLARLNSDNIMEQIADFYDGVKHYATKAVKKFLSHCGINI